jgi:branched-subunit amino acid transport protein
VTFDLVGLAVLMWSVTYPWRAIPLLAPRADRLPAAALTYLRLVGPAVLTSLAAVNVFVLTRPDGTHHFRIGIEAAAVLISTVVVARRRHVLPGLVIAVALVAAARAGGLS